MIPVAIDRAVVEVRDGGKVLGAAFLALPGGYFTTAKHVVGARSSVMLRFFDGAELAADIVDVGTADWALLQVVAPLPQGVRPVPLADTSYLGGVARWYSVGFANQRDGQRGGFHGTLRRVGPPLELYCAELVGAPYEAARGLSGGPCVIDGEVVGIIVDVTYDASKGTIVAGEAVALPWGGVTSAKVQVTFSAGAPLPWELVFEGALAGLVNANLAIAAEAAGLPVGHNKPQRIARRMINEGIGATSRVLKQLSADLDAKKRDQLMSLAATLWVSETAAEELAAIVDRTAAGHLASESEDSANQHCQRAFACRRSGAEAWRYEHLPVTTSDEPFVDAVVAAAYARLGAKDESKRPEIKKLVKDAGQPIVVFVPSPPRDDVVAELKAELPELTVVFLSLTAPAQAEQSSVRSIRPAPTPGEEDAARRSCRAAWFNLDPTRVQ